MFDEITTETFHKKLLKRNTEAFKTLYETFKVPLFHLVFSIIKDIDKTADIIQETFIKVIKNIQQLEDIKKIKYWIYRIAVNQSFNVIRRDNRFTFAGDDIIAIVDQTVQVHHCTRERVDSFNDIYNYVREEIDRLPIKQRLAFTLKYIDNLKEVEIGEILEIPVGTVKSRLNTARTAIKENLIRQFGLEVESYLHF